MSSWVRLFRAAPAPVVLTWVPDEFELSRAVTSHILRNNVDENTSHPVLSCEQESPHAVSSHV